MQKTTATDFQHEYNLTDEEYAKLLRAGKQVKQYIDNFWQFYQAPVPRRRILNYWRTFPTKVNREAAYRFLASIGYYTIIPSPTAREYVFSSNANISEDEMIQQVIHIEQQQVKRKKHDTNQTD